MERAKIIVKGEVQNVDFRGFVIEQMLSLGLNGYANNLPDGTVEVLCEGEKDRIDELIAKIRGTPPHFATVESAEPEWQEYIGDLNEPERRGEDIPTEGTQEKMLKVMQSFDQKAEILNKRVGDVASNTEGMSSDMRDMASTLKAFKEESNQNFQTLGGKIDSGFEKTDQDFKELRQEYGKISSDISVAVKGIEQVAKNTEKILEHLSQQQENLTDAINGQTKAILALAEKKS